MDKNELVEYISDTLIPDLRESGMDATADDFQSLLDVIKEQDEKIGQMSQHIRDVNEVLKRG